MEEVKVIRSLEELFVYAREVEKNKGEGFRPIKLDGEFPIALHVEGSSWDGRVDRRSAQYVLALQNSVEDLLAEFAPESKAEEALVKVKVENGSFLSEVDFGPFLNTLAANMTDWQSFICAMTGVAALGGYFWWNRYMSYRENLKLEQERTKQAQAQETERTAQEKARQETLKDAFDALRAVAEKDPVRYAPYERPVRVMVKSLEDADTLEVCRNGEKMPAAAVRQCGPRRAPRSGEAVTYGDGSFIVNSRRYDEGEVVLELEQGGVEIKGYLWQFDEGDREAFLQSVDKHEKEDALPFSMDLQVNVVHTGKKLKHAVIIGEGSPREGKTCIPLNQILAR